MLNFFDRMIAVFDPTAALKRAKARFYLAEVNKHSRILREKEKERRYEGVSKSRRTNDWVTSGTSINAENLSALAMLRQRHRDLVQNNYWASRAVKAIGNHTVGTGIMPNFTNVTKAQKKKLKLAWDTWSEKDSCDFEGMLNMAGLQKLVMKTVVNSGECIIRKRRVNVGPGQNPIQIQVQEPDVIDTSKDGITSQDGGTIIQGIEYNKQGKRVAYWLYEQHPGDSRSILSFQSKRIPATDVIHVFETLRPGQVRGIPFGVTAMIRLKDFDDYEDAQIVRQKIAACFTAFVTSEVKISALSGSGPVAEETKDREERLEPGMITYLNQGEEINFGTPPAVPEYSSFSKNVLLGIATAYGITYEALTGDLSGSNFSSSRMGWLEMARNVSDWQYQLMVPLFCEPVFRWFMQGAVIAGLVKEGATCRWTAPRREMFDPGKELAAMILAIQGGLTSWSEVIRELGFDPKDMLEEIKDDQAEMDKLGLMFTSDPRFKGSPKPSGPDPEEEDPESGSGTDPKKEPKKQPA